MLQMNESEWQKLVTTHAVSLGWDWLHIGRIGKYQANGAKGTLGKGWVDLLFCRPGRMFFAELKVDGQQLSPEQKQVIVKLMDSGHDVYVWRPSDIAQVLDVLSAS